MVLRSEGANARVVYVWPIGRSSGVCRAVDLLDTFLLAGCCSKPWDPVRHRHSQEYRLSEEPDAPSTALCLQDNGSHDGGSTGGCASPEGTVTQSSGNREEDFQDEVRLGKQQMGLEKRLPG